MALTKRQIGRKRGEQGEGEKNELFILKCMFLSTNTIWDIGKKKSLCKSKGDIVTALANRVLHMCIVISVYENSLLSPQFPFSLGVTKRPPPGFGNILDTVQWLRYRFPFFFVLFFSQKSLCFLVKDFKKCKGKFHFCVRLDTWWSHNSSFLLRHSDLWCQQL